MIGTKSPPHPGLYLLADHLDATLALGEDLLARKLPPLADSSNDRDVDAIAAFCQQVEQLEALMVARILQARRRATETTLGDAMADRMLELFRASTSATVDLIDHFSQRGSRSSS